MTLNRTAFTLLFTCLCTPLAQAQSTQETKPDSLLKPLITIPLDTTVVSAGSSLIGLDDIERDLLVRLREIYEYHDKALEAQIQQDLVATEEYITAAVNTTQRLMEEMPELQSNRRFIALYRTVMTEYQEFYGILEPFGDVEGDIFEVHDELFNSDDNFFASEYLPLPNNLSFGKTDVPLLQNTTVNSYMAYYWIRRPDVMEKWLERSELYFPMMERIFREEGVPSELVYLSMIESGLVPVATSRAKAVGLWQFMKATGAMYGLKVDSWVDERRDPEKSTRAAARHLKDLYNVWGDWHLALAGYNVSPGRIRSSIKNAGNVKDYWVISPYLPAETRGYVPSYIAATLIASNREQFGFKRRYREEGRSLEWEVFPVKGSLSLDQLAGALNITTDSLRFLNPELLRNVTPPGKEPYPLKIPKGSKALFEVTYAQLPQQVRSADLTHQVKKGETLGVIARKYDTTVRELMEINPGLSAKIQIGQQITIPSTRIESPSAASKSSSAPAQVASNAPANNQANMEQRIHTVRKGETLGRIAQRYGTTVKQLQTWNKVGTTIQVGQKLVVYAPSAAATAVAQTSSGAGKTTNNVVRYTVKANDNLHNIARLHNVSVDSIKRSNNLNSNMIRPGQVLVIER